MRTSSTSWLTPIIVGVSMALGALITVGILAPRQISFLSLTRVNVQQETVKKTPTSPLRVVYFGNNTFPNAEADLLSKRINSMAYIEKETYLPAYPKCWMRHVTFARDLVSAGIRSQKGWNKNWHEWLMKYYETKVWNVYGNDTFITFLDIGANIGAYSIAVSALLRCHYGFGNGGWATISFEPVPYMMQMLIASAAVNGFQNNWIYPYALGNDTVKRNTPVSIFFGGYNAGASRLKGDAPLTGRRWVPTTIQMTNLDDVFHAATNNGTDVEMMWVWSHVFVMKIDVETFERQVFLGGRDFFAKHGPCVILSEIIMSIEERTKYMKLMTELGYILTHDGVRPVLPSEYHQPNTDWDVIYVRKGEDECVKEKAMRRKSQL